MNAGQVFDASGRYLAEAQTELTPRPAGPWSTNAAPVAPLRVVCAWCPDFDPTDKATNANATHGICQACEAKF